MQRDAGGTDTAGPAQLRWSDPRRDRVARVEVIRRAWHASYREIFTPREIDATFDGALSMSGGWTHRRSAEFGTVVAEIEQEVVGLVGLCQLDASVGEVAALYVLPAWQGRGVGRQLWNCARDLLRHELCGRIEVWALERAPAPAFYEHMGCRRFAMTEFHLGDHREQAVGLELEALD